MSNTEEINETLPVSQPQTSETTFKPTYVTLVDKLLQFSCPRLDSKLVNVLFLDGMIDIIMTHLTRLDPSQPVVRLDKCSRQQKIEYSLHKRDREDKDATKRSYHAMELLSGTTANHLWIHNVKFYDIVKHLFDIFLPNSNGNFNHFSKIFEHLIRRHPNDVLEYVVINDCGTILFDYLLPYITQSAVMDSLIYLIFVRDINPEIKFDREKAYRQLADLGFLEWIIVSIQINQYPEFADAAQEFLMRIITEASQMESGGFLFSSLNTEEGADIIKVLVMQIVQHPPSPKRERAIMVIKHLIKSGILSTRSSNVAQPVQGPLYHVSLRVQELLINHIPDFCSLLITDRQNTTRRSVSLTTMDMDLLVIVYQALYNTNEKIKMLASIPTAFWKLLVNSFFEKSTSSIYHALFYRIVHLILTINHEPSLIVLVRKQCLITRLIDAYEENKTDAKGFILLILNQLRLMADAKQSDLIQRIISTHPRYQQFLPTLRKDTLTQIQPRYQWRLQGSSRPPPYIGPSPPIQSMHVSPYSGAIPLMHAVENEDSLGIDLGSDFAFCLGFKEASKGTETPHGYLSRTSSVNEFPMDIIWANR